MYGSDTVSDAGLLFQLTVIQEGAASSLVVDGEAVYSLAAKPLYLLLAKTILLDCRHLLSHCQVGTKSSFQHLAWVYKRKLSNLRWKIKQDRISISQYDIFMSVQQESNLRISVKYNIMFLIN